MKNIIEKIKKLFSRKEFLLSLCVLVIIGAAFAGYFIFSNKGDGFNVNNDNNNNIEISNVENGYTIEKEIIVSNDGDRDFTYDLVWVNVTNKFITQSDLLYTIEGQGTGAVQVGKSQVPVVDSPIMTNIKITPGKIHTYKLKIWYDKSKDSKNDKSVNFEGYVTAKKNK